MFNVAEDSGQDKKGGPLALEKFSRGAFENKTRPMLMNQTECALPVLNRLTKYRKYLLEVAAASLYLTNLQLGIQP
jgi:hypothetical protein